MTRGEWAKTEEGRALAWAVRQIREAAILGADDRRVCSFNVRHDLEEARATLNAYIDALLPDTDPRADHEAWARYKALPDDL